MLWEPWWYGIVMSIYGICLWLMCWFDSRLVPIRWFAFVYIQCSYFNIGFVRNAFFLVVFSLFSTRRFSANNKKKIRMISPSIYWCHQLSTLNFCARWNILNVHNLHIESERVSAAFPDYRNQDINKRKSSQCRRIVWAGLEIYLQF